MATYRCPDCGHLIKITPKQPSLTIAYKGKVKKNSCFLCGAILTKKDKM